MTLDTASSPKKNTTVMFGLICGGAGILFTVLLYLGGAEMFVSPVAYLGLVIPIVVAVIGGLQYRKQQGGYLEFSAALKVTFQILVIGSLIATVFQHILFNYIDPSFRQALSQVSAEKAEKLMRKFGAPDEQIDKATEEMINNNNYTIGKLFLGFAFSCILWFIVALIISAVIKRKRPPFENSFKQ
jgi:hypothetical protein